MDARRIATVERGSYPRKSTSGPQSPSKYSSPVWRTITIFLPSRRAHDARGAHLRKVLNITEDSPLKSRTVRDHIEHFDEKLDIYLGSMTAGYVVPYYFGPTPASCGVPQHYFRAYFVDSGTFEILGHQVAIEPLIVEAMRVHNLLVEFEENGERFPHD